MSNTKGALKPGWKRVVFRDLIANINDYFDRCKEPATRYLAGQHIDEGDLTVRRWGSTDDSIFPPTFKRRFQTGDVLFHSRNPKKLASPQFSGVTGEKLFILRSKDTDVLLQEFIPFLLLTDEFSDYVQRTRSGSVNKFLNWTPLSKYEFALPPVEEQRRIAKALAAIELFRCSLIDAAFAANQVTLSYQQLLFPSRNVFGTKWISYRLEGVCSNITDGKHGDCQDQDESGYFFVSAKDLDDDSIVYTQARQITECDFLDTHKRTRLEPGDILVSNSGSIGKMALVRDDSRTPKTTFQKSVAIIKPNHDLVDCRWLFYWLRSKRPLLERISQGSAQRNLLLGDLRKMQILIPHRDVQIVTVTKIAALDTAVSKIKHRIDALRQLARSSLPGPATNPIPSTPSFPLTVGTQKNNIT